MAAMAEAFRALGSLEFAKPLLEKALVENEHRIRQAARGIKRALTGEPWTTG